MTLNGAIMELVMLSEHPIMPVIFKPSIQKIIETVSECEEPKRKTEWIPCSEQLPDRDGRYLVTNNRIGEWSIDCDVFSTTEESFLFGKNVIAWMPLPKPYRR